MVEQVVCLRFLSFSQQISVELYAASVQTNKQSRCILHANSDMPVGEEVGIISGLYEKA